jgi:hypothetical protein
VFEVYAGLSSYVGKLKSVLMDAEELDSRLEMVMVLPAASVCCAVMGLRFFYKERQDRKL